jgi:TonB family protein
MTSSIWLHDLASYSLQVLVLIGAGALLARLFRLRASTATLVYWQALLGLCLILPFCQRWQADVTKARVSEPAVAAAVNASPAVAAVPARARRPILWPVRWPVEWPTRRPIRLPIDQTVLFVIAGGILARGLWLAAGFRGLARLRRRSAREPDALAPVLDDAQRQLGVRAEFRMSTRAPAAITFGLRRPVILLPANAGSMEPESLRAIVCHELLHVRRRDWAWCVVEEFVRAAVWFHPAVWWLIGRIHLTREQVVDQAVIGLTASRERYVEALLAVAQAHIDARLIPAPLFLRKGLLKKRVAEILKERTMTTRRLILCLTLSAAALFMVVRTAPSIFPLRVHAQELGSAPIQVLQGGDNLTHRAALVYPGRAIERRIEGDVALEVSVDEQGQVSDARVLSGPEELRRACLQSILEWRFRTPATPSIEVVVHFQLPKDGSSSEVVLPAVPAESENVRTFVMYSPSNDAARLEIKELQERLQSPDTTDEDKAKLKKRIAELMTQLDGNPKARVVDAEKLESEATELKAALADANTPPEQRAVMKKQLAERLAQIAESRGDEGTALALITEDEPVNGQLRAIRTERVPQATLDALTPGLGVRVGDMINDEMSRQVRETVRRNLGEQYRAVFHSTDNGGVELVIVGP